MIPLFLKTLRHFITLQIVFEKHPAPQAIVPFAPISVCQSSVEGFVVFPANEPHDLPILRLRNKGEVAFFNQDLGVIPQQELVAVLHRGREKAFIQALAAGRGVFFRVWPNRKHHDRAPRM